ncbi:MAG: 4Fe-4S dicluster domain-containing protein [Lachnospiraceae bacterium]|nr:4Fe-4S dicluster domain-containing protein [Lachnospiraceae bacterium]
MDISSLQKIARENGVVGAGGAGFPSYAKMTEKADAVLLNCVECEPLLKLHRQLLAMHAAEIVGMLDEVRKTLKADEAVIGIKSEYTETIEALEEVIKDHPSVRISKVRAAYPMGDEVILIYEALGRVVPPGGLPAEVGVVVYNVETMYNLYRAVHLGIPVTDKLVSIVGETDHPVTLRLPIGVKTGEAVRIAGSITCNDPAYLMGGPMMGRMGTYETPIIKTTNAVIILSRQHELIMKMKKNLDVEIKRASSACCQCRTCTDLCSRHALGHPIEPHRIMRAAADRNTSDPSVFINSAFCSGCGICEKYACPQGLSPRAMIQEFKIGLKKEGINAGRPESAPVASDREYRKVPVHRLASRLGLAPYDVPAPLEDEPVSVSSVKIPLSQHIGAPARAIVKKGDTVKRGQMIGEAAEGLSVAVHASIDGTVTEISDRYIEITS